MEKKRRKAVEKVADRLTHRVGELEVEIEKLTESVIVSDRVLEGGGSDDDDTDCPLMAEYDRRIEAIKQAIRDREANRKN